MFPRGSIKPAKPIQRVFDFVKPEYSQPKKKLFAAPPTSTPPSSVVPEKSLFPGLTQLQDDFGKKHHTHAWVAYKRGEISRKQYQAIITGLESQKFSIAMNRVREKLGLGQKKTAEVKEQHYGLKKLIKAKKFSDNKNYGAKHEILGEMMRRSPEDFFVDSRINKKFVGITHTPTNFKLHVPRTLVPINVEKRAEILRKILHTQSH
jgi:hypothetical protein